MNHGKLITIMALTFFAPQVHAVENKNVTPQPTLQNSQHNSQHVKKRIEDLNETEVHATPTGNYDKLLDEQAGFKQIIEMYEAAADAVKNPIEIKTVNVQKGVEFNVAPTMTADQGIMNLDKIKMMVNVTAKFL